MAGKRKKSVDDMSIQELRQIIIEKQRAERSRQPSQYRRSNRMVNLEPAATPGLLSEDLSPSDDDLDAFLPDRKPKRTFFDRMLVGIEVIAVVGLIFIFFNIFGLLRNLNQEAIAAMTLPTLTPTAIIQAVVLPSGHTPPTDPGGVRFNESEIPEHLRAHVQAMASLPLPTASPEQAIRIRIPAISVDAPIVMGDGEEQLKKGVGQYIHSSNPGQNGNLVLSAHNDVFGEIFRDLDQLQPGDEVIVYTNQRAYTYVVQQQQVVGPLQVEVMAPTTEPVVTLISCYPYMVDTHRIVISATQLDQ
jgi:sortase A